MSQNTNTKALVSALTMMTAIGGAAACYLFLKRRNENQDIHPHTVCVTLPPWAVQELRHNSSKTFTSDEEMMRFAIHLSQMNVDQGTGGPFGTAIFERMPDQTAKLVSVGVNRVVPLWNSTLHGEVVAIQMAQSKLKSFTLLIPETTGNVAAASASADVTPCRIRRFELFTSCEPCCMCLGAVLWSGISRMVCGATKEDAEKIGFDEGPVFEESYAHLNKAGISVTKLVLREEGRKVLNHYASFGPIYVSTHGL